MTTPPSSVKDVDFEVLSEDWTKFRLKPDNATFRVRLVVAKILDTGLDKMGAPNFGIGAKNCLSVVVPPDLLKPIGEAPELTGPIQPEHVKEGTEIDFELIGQLKWQEYKTSTGWLVMLRPEVGRIVKLKYYVKLPEGGLMEPIYWANIQSVFRVKKA